MKKRILAILFVALSGALTTNAQLLPSFDLGLKAGLNFTSLRHEGSYFNSETGAGFLAGAWGRVGIAGFHIQPELYYTNKNSKISAASESGEQTAKLSTVDLPVLLGTKFGIGPLGARVQVGPLFSFVVDKDTRLDSEELRLKDNFASFVGGVGVDVSKFTVDLRYEHGLGNFSQTTPKNTLNLWTISLGLKLL